MNPILELRNVQAGYGRIGVLHGVDLTVAPGQIVALLGPNGAGKTTLLRVAAGVHPISGGGVFLAGHDTTRMSPRDLARLGICLIPEGRGIFPNLTVRENLLMMTFTGRSVDEVEEIACARFPILGKRMSQTAGTMSGGEQQMLALARGLATDPAVLMLDELSMGLAPLIVSELYEHVTEIARQGVAVLVVEQFATTVLHTADHAAVLVRGRIETEGPPDELSSELASLYLGSAS